LTFIDIVQTASLIGSLFAIGAWFIRLRRWPLIIAVVVAMLANVCFYVARTFNLFSPTDLNIFSAVRVLLMVIVIAAIPFSVRKT
jgi:uncharacterized membrane protein YoaK (UPF0700 family)